MIRAGPVLGATFFGAAIAVPVAILPLPSGLICCLAFALYPATGAAYSFLDATPARGVPTVAVGGATAAIGVLLFQLLFAAVASPTDPVASCWASQRSRYSHGLRRYNGRGWCCDPKSCPSQATRSPVLGKEVVRAPNNSMEPTWPAGSRCQRSLIDSGLPAGVCFQSNYALRAAEWACAAGFCPSCPALAGQAAHLEAVRRLIVPPSSFGGSGTRSKILGSYEEG